jgi:hypothetical protein
MAKSMRKSMKAMKAKKSMKKGGMRKKAMKKSKNSFFTFTPYRRDPSNDVASGTFGTLRVCG